MKKREETTKCIQTELTITISEGGKEFQPEECIAFVFERTERTRKSVLPGIHMKIYQKTKDDIPQMMYVECIEGSIDELRDLAEKRDKEMVREILKNIIRDLEEEDSEEEEEE